MMSAAACSRNSPLLSSSGDSEAAVHVFRPRSSRVVRHPAFSAASSHGKIGSSSVSDVVTESVG